MLPRRGLFGLVSLLLLALVAQPALAMGRGQVTIVTASGASHTFKVEITETPAERERGMMFRESMAPDAGMLFPSDTPQMQSFWMKNTLIPLDIIFIAADGRITNIVTGKPHDLTFLSSTRPATAVLEINGGLAARLGIRAGDLVRHAHFGNAGG